MKLKQFLIEDDNAVSPVIGVILMVAITVILAAVIAAFVLNLGQSTGNTTPQATFNWDLDNSGSDNVLTITHDGGDTLEAGEIYLRGTGDGSNDIGANWNDDVKSGSDIKAGSSVRIGNGLSTSNDGEIGKEVSTSYDMKVVWEPSDKDTSNTLSESSGSDA